VSDCILFVMVWWVTFEGTHRAALNELTSAVLPFALETVAE